MSPSPSPTALWLRQPAENPPVPRSRATRLMGAPIRHITEQAAVQAIITAAESELGHWTITANLDHLRRYQRDPVARALMDNADLLVADGMPLIWASRLAGTPLPERVTGSNMIWSICDLASRRGQSVFLLGGDPGVADRAAELLLDRYPDLDIAGTSCPRRGFESDDQELRRLQREVTSAGPQIVLVALGFPKQDLLIGMLRSSLPGAAFLGVGISLSYITGDVARAPVWTRRLGLEWAYRLAQEPVRLTRRYLVDGLPFAIHLLASASWQRARRGGPSSSWGSHELPPRTVEENETLAGRAYARNSQTPTVAAHRHTDRRIEPTAR
jgi:N-acetylglucosaminyldiphosphoundecaprenol N-acetyl-beta-D-mannosaminyltransferase